MPRLYAAPKSAHHGQEAGYPMTISLKVNGATVSVPAEPDTPLLYVLRNDLALNGAKFGCGLSQCGSCTVLVDGQPVRSCVTPIGTLGSSEITTIEGLGTVQKPHPLQLAFIDEQAAQCGYCINGMLMTAKGLLDRNPHPSETEVRQGLALNLCRCGTHNRIVRAVLRAADAPEVMLAQQPPKLPGSLAGNPRLDAWIHIDPDGNATVFTGKVELGQGIVTALAQIAAEELDLPLERVHMISGDTARTPNEGVTSGSQSIEYGGTALRLAGAEVRAILIDAAAKKLGIAPGTLTVSQGTISAADGRKVTYGEIAGAIDLKRDATAN